MNTPVCLEQHPKRADHFRATVSRANSPTVGYYGVERDGSIDWLPEPDAKDAALLAAAWGRFSAQRRADQKNRKMMELSSVWAGVEGIALLP